MLKHVEVECIDDVRVDMENETITFAVIHTTGPIGNWNMRETESRDFVFKGQKIGVWELYDLMKQYDNHRATFVKSLFEYQTLDVLLSVRRFTLKETGDEFFVCLDTETESDLYDKALENINRDSLQWYMQTN